MTLSPGISRLAALGLLLIALMAFWTLIAEPIAAGLESRDSAILETRDRLARTQMAAARLPGLEAQRAELAAALESGDGFLRGGSEDVVAADLQERIKEVIGRAGGTLKSTQALSVETEAGLSRAAADE